MTKGRSTTPRITRLNRRLRERSMASHTPSTVLKVRAMAVKTKEFCTVWRKVSLARMSRKFLRPTKGPGEPTQ